MGRFSSQLRLPARPLVSSPSRRESPRQFRNPVFPDLRWLNAAIAWCLTATPGPSVTGVFRHRFFFVLVFPEAQFGGGAGKEPGSGKCSPPPPSRCPAVRVNSCRSSSQCLACRHEEDDPQSSVLRWAGEGKVPRRSFNRVRITHFPGQGRIRPGGLSEHHGADLRRYGR